MTMRTVAALAVLACAGTGCALGPRVVQASAAGYNQALQRTTDEQLLLNLVRLKYRDSPMFLEVRTLAAQFSVRRSARIGGRVLETIIPNSTNFLDAGAEVVYEERPTITYTPLRGEEYVNRYMSPLSLDTLVLLYNSGWSVDRVLRLTVQRMNGAENAMSGSGPTPVAAPQFQTFAAATQALRALQQAGQLDLGYESYPTALSQALPAKQVTPNYVMQAAQQSMHFTPADEPGTLRLTKLGRRVVLLIAPAGVTRPEAELVRDTFSLAPDRTRYELVAGPGRLPGDGNGLQERLVLSTRSLLGVLFYLSHGIEVPRHHEDRGYVTTTYDSAGERFDWNAVTGDLLRIRVAERRPGNAAVAVPYRGAWFYVAQNDLGSKSTFALLGHLISLQAGGGDAAVPVLTLPIGG